MGSPTVEQVRQIVAADEKTRYTLSEDDDVLWIRCNQGHSLKGVDQNHLLRRISDPDECPVAVHGTYWKSLGPIVSNGLNRMGRQHIHFLKDSPDLLLARHRPTAGIRSSCNVLIFVDVRKAIQEGFHFYVSDNGVILTEGPIASSYFIKVLELLPGDETRPISLEEVLGGQ